MQIVFLVMMFVFGAAFGSFLCCEAQRLRERERHHRAFGRRSICLHCRRQLKWYDNIPLLSWLILRGKCRFCHHPIGHLEILSELGLAVAFTALSAQFLLATDSLTPVGYFDFSAIPLTSWLGFIATLLLTICLGFLAIYDGAYGELPTAILLIALVFAVVKAVTEPNADYALAAASAAILGGIYLLLYLASKGRWVGDGDWILAGIIGLALGRPWLALIALFVANLSATVISAPAAIKRRRHQIYFGPYLVLAFVIVSAFSDFFISMI